MTKERILSLASAKAKDNVAELHKKRTYETVLLEHLNSLTKEQKESEVGMLITMSTVEEGAAFCIVEGDDILAVVGLIASCNQFLIGDI